MNKKLTLSLEESIINKAKIFAHENRESLSQLVENYFKIITSNTEAPQPNISPLVAELIGSIKVPEDFNYEQTKYDYLKRKYLND